MNVYIVDVDEVCVRITRSTIVIDIEDVLSVYAMSETGSCMELLKERNYKEDMEVGSIVHLTGMGHKSVVGDIVYVGEVLVVSCLDD